MSTTAALRITYVCNQHMYIHSTPHQNKLHIEKIVSFDPEHGAFTKHICLVIYNNPRFSLYSRFLRPKINNYIK
jgi:hypothetical protein